MYALETWYVLCGHAICLLGIEYAVWTCYVSSGDGICCVDMLYAFWRWNMLCGHAICLLGIEYALWTCYMSATRSDMYLRENIFEKNGPEKVTLFFEFIYFSNRPGSMIVRTAPCLRSISMRNCLKLIVFAKCGLSLIHI